MEGLRTDNQFLPYLITFVVPFSKKLELLKIITPLQIEMIYSKIY